ncbi:MAG: ACT domain-containing protein, partial [Deltaproteobacteria bacterium]|nr:ACT domain-containing protein [Deltaproteobacteria bacterium]
TATRRDLNDEKVIVQCARTIGNVKRLKMLYLLTWADSRATGPRAWNEWIANLVQELFFKILHLLEKGDLATPDASRKVKSTLSRVRRNLAGKMDGKKMEMLFETMSPRYILETGPRDIVSHLESYQKFQQMTLDHGMPVFQLETYKQEAEGYWGVTFLAKDRPGLFSDIAGVMALHNINILSAHIYTWRDGTAIDLFKVTSPLDKIHAEETWEKLRGDFKNIFTEALSLESRLTQKATPSILSTKKGPSYPLHINVDNDSSDFFTVIEVFASDRIGLLYLITHTLFSLNLDIRIAKIATKADQIADVFYVRDLDGQKVIDPEQIEKIERALVHRLEAQKYKNAI